VRLKGLGKLKKENPMSSLGNLTCDMNKEENFDTRAKYFTLDKYISRFEFFTFGHAKNSFHTECVP
jgi:hypothetical protein